MALQSFQLIMRTGPSPEKAFSLSQTEIYIGRDISNDIVINDAEISRKHARLSLQTGAYTIEDLGSTNGTSVNSARLYGPTALRSGDIIQLGENVTLVYEVSTYDPDATLAINQSAMKAALEQHAAPVPAPVEEPKPITSPGYEPLPDPQTGEMEQSPLVEVPSFSKAAAPSYTPQPTPPPSSTGPAYIPPPPSSAGPAYVPPPPSSAGPAYVPPPPSQARAPKSKPNKTLTLVGIGCLAIFICVVAAGSVLWYIDAQNLWCQIIPALPGCIVP